MPHYTINASINEDEGKVDYTGQCQDCLLKVTDTRLDRLDADLFNHYMNDCPMHLTSH